MRNFVYVAQVLKDDHKITLAIFDSRAMCEDAIENGLPELFRQNNVKMSDCDLFTVEQWELNGFLEKDRVTTLTSYNKLGQKDRVLVAPGMEGKSKKEKEVNRFRKLANQV